MQWVNLIWKMIGFISNLFGFGKDGKLKAAITAAQTTAKRVAVDKLAKDEAIKAADELNRQLNKSFTALAKLPDNSKRKKILENDIDEGDKTLASILDIIQRM